MLYALYFVFVLYVGILFALSRGWDRVIHRRKNKPGSSPSVSVVLAVRNEEHNIARLLEDLSVQTYPHMELIIVDDHSTDRTREIVSDYCVSGRNVKLIRSSGVGKKQALTSGIDVAQHEIIVTTDADCRVGHDWVEKVSATFADDEVRLVFGLVRMENKSFFDNVQAVEFGSVVGMGVGAFGLGIPVFCNAANLAFRKSAFVQVRGYEGNLNVPSGDDEFLLRKIKVKWPGGIRLTDPSAIVTTQPNPTVTGLFNQRIRWAGKWKYAPFASRAMAVITALIHMAFLVALFMMGSGTDLVVLPVLWGLKMVVEYYFLHRVCNVVKIRIRPASFLFLQITYSLYVVSIGLLSNFVSYRWKERTIPPLVS